MKTRRIAILLLALGTAGTAEGGRLDPHAYIEKAVDLIESETYELARTYLDPAVISHRLSPGERSRAYYLRGYSFYAQHLFASAAADYTHALEFNPDNPVALFALGSLYQHADGREYDPELALQLFHRAAELGHAPAQLYVGNAYLTGEGAAKNVEQARDWLQAAAEAGFAPAMSRLATSYRESYTDSPEPEVARHWYEQAVAAGDTDALVALGFMFENGELGEQPPGAAIKLFSEAAGKGSGLAMTLLGHAYMTGRGVPTDFALARDWFLQATERDAPGSFASLGHMHEAGLGVPADIDTAESWYEKGSEAGDTDAMVRLLYLLADSGRDAEAAQWAHRASAAGDARALNAYAWLLATSRTPAIRDGKLALEHAQRAVDLDRNAAYLDTLAAAYAELARFEDALTVQRQALAAAGDDPALIEELRAHLAAYEQGRPWRE